MDLREFSYIYRKITRIAFYHVLTGPVIYNSRMKTQNYKPKKKTEYSHPGFGRRLDYVMFTHGITNKELSKLMNMSPSAISGYRTGRRAPALDDFIRLARILRVSTDYLLGLSDNMYSK
jgi:plasmid maintenance system antidote protein VapI